MNLATTLDLIHTAQAEGADLIELDVIKHGGLVRVAHDDGDNSGPPLALVLNDAQLVAGNQVLFVEIKENNSPAFITQLLAILQANGHGVPCRPVVLRAFHQRRHHILFAQAVLSTSFASMRDHVMLNELFQASEVPDPPTYQARFDQTLADGLHGIEVEYRSPNLLGMLKYGAHLGLGTGIYTVPVTFGEVFVANAREDVDFITTDYPVDKARAVVEDDNALIYLNVWNQPDTREVVYLRGNGRLYPHPLTAQAPGLVRGPAGEDFHGYHLDFVAANRDHLRFYDADNDPGDGFLVTAAVNFDDTILADGDTAALLGKADSGGFSLELHNPPGLLTTVLRFGVRVGGAYRYATISSAILNTTDNYLITGAYDGNGRVRLWVNNQDTGVTPSASYTGGVEQNNSDVLGGADPQGSGSPRFYVDAKIQQLSVQKWADH